MPADPTNMRDRIAESATQWALMYPLANWGFWGFAKGEARDQIAAVADDLAAAWGRDIADRVLAELFTATDPGGDLHRQTVEHLGQAWPDLTEDPVYLDQLAHEALSVRWGHAVRQAVEVERLRKELAETKRERDANHDKALIASRIHNYGGQVSCDDVTMLLRQAEAERDAWQRTSSFHLDERDQQRQRAEQAEAAIERGLALCDEYANEHPEGWRPLAVETAKVFRAALDQPTEGVPDAG